MQQFSRAVAASMIGALLITLACKPGEDADPKEERHNAHWGYGEGEGPDHWAELDKNYRRCAYGHKQSPINIETAGKHAHDGKHSIKFNYHRAEPDIENDGHTIKISFEQAGEFYFDNKRHELKQFHFHTPSEHTIDGQRFPMEMHLVHQSADNHFLVIGVLFEEGPANEMLSVFDHDLPTAEIKKHLHRKIDLSGVVNDDKHFYHYQGSLTTPPCSEGVKWLVQKEHPAASREQIAAIQRIEGHNARPTQAKHGRAIEKQ